MVGAAHPDRRDDARIRELLTVAQGYAVFGSDRKRVGAFIEVAAAPPDQIAIRDDGVFLWRRRMLPIKAVAAVLSEHRAVVLNVDSRSVASSASGRDPVGEPPEPAQPRQPSEEVQERVARYLSPLRTETEARHLAFVSGAQGYTIVELPGPPPALGANIEIADVPGSFIVAKLASAPLPNDPRVCAYLEPVAPEARN